MNTIDKIMALADRFADYSASYPERLEIRNALRAAITEALDMGEPVAWFMQDMDNNFYECDSDQAGAIPLYAAKDAK